jgi:hypothetical protein
MVGGRHGDSILTSSKNRISLKVVISRNQLARIARDAKMAAHLATIGLSKALVLSGWLS